LVPGQGEEDVVEVRGVHGQLGDVNAAILEAGEDPAQVWHAATGGDLEGERLHVGLAGPRDDRLGLAEGARVGEPEPDVPAGDQALELVRRALGDQRAVIQ
jgi:hypothetical protein